MKGACKTIAAICAAFFLVACVGLAMRAAYPRPYRAAVEESGVPPALAYAVMKAESNFSERAVSRVGAVGVMQVRPATAQFVCEMYGLPYSPERLTEGAYNAMIGCRYLAYLLARFPDECSAVCAYNAGEGRVRSWLADPRYSDDGTLCEIPFAETRTYQKKVANFRKKYEILYE